MPIPPYATLMLPILRLAAERTWTYRELIKQISDDFRLTESERKEKTSDGSASVIDDQVHRARMDLKDRGLIEKSREAYLQISTSGRRLLVSNPHGIDSFPLLPSPASITSPSEPKGKDGTIAEPSYGLFAGTARKYEEQILAAAQSLDEHLRDLLVPKILEKSPLFFEKLIINLMLKMGYGDLRIDAAKHLGGTADGGVDGVIHEDQLGLDRVYLQAKCYQPGATIGPETVRAFIGSLSVKGAKKGVLVTTSSFSRQARDEADRLSDRKVVLIDGAELATLMVRFNVGVQAASTVEMKRFDLDFFDEGTTG